ncbi:MAG: sigma-70 family RNA polymerase sigma factor [Acidobacteria bacterium]|nr:sigma-70 family RNA polymerase sigma factor [Acidobacteriota bacterium]
MRDNNPAPIKPSPDPIGQAYTEVFDEGFRGTVRFLSSKGIGEDLAEELAQSAWARGWERRSQIREISAIPYWVNSIALNMLRRHVQHPSNQMRELMDREASSVDAMLHLDVKRVLSSCETFDRRLLEMFYLEGLSSSEIGKKLNEKAMTIRVRLHRLRKRIREAFDPVDLQPAAA